MFEESDISIGSLMINLLSLKAYLVWEKPCSSTTELHEDLTRKKQERDEWIRTGYSNHQE
jgi:hypothetical protein